MFKFKPGDIVIKIKNKLQESSNQGNDITLIWISGQ